MDSMIWNGNEDKYLVQTWSSYAQDWYNKTEFDFADAAVEYALGLSEDGWQVRVLKVETTTTPIPLD